MAIPFLNDINLNENELLNAKLHTDSSAPSNPGTGSVWFDTGSNLLKIYRGGSWTNLFVKTEAISDGGTNLATADQIHTFVTAGTSTMTNKTLTNPTINAVRLLQGSGNILLDSNIFRDNSGSTDAHNYFGFNGDNVFRIGTNNQETIVATSGTAILKHGGNTKLSTSSTGVSVTGTVTATSFTGNLTGNADTVTTNANLTGDVTSSGNATTIAADAVHATMINDDIISAQTELSSGVADADEMLISDSGAVKKVGMDTLKTYFTGDDVSVANLTARLPQITESLTIGDATDVTLTTSGNLVVTGDLTVSGDTISANVATLDVEDKNITLNYSSGDSSSTANGSGITIQDAVDATTDATILWDASNDEFDFSHKINVTGGITGTILTASQTNITAIGTIATGTWAATDIAIAHGGTGASTASAAFDNLKQAATATATGVVELATTTEASTGTDTSRAVTAEGLQQFHNDRNKSFELDNSASGVASSDNITYTITHGMGASRLYKVEVIEDASNYETVYAEVQRPSDTTIKVIFGSAVTAGAYRALITKI